MNLCNINVYFKVLKNKKKQGANLQNYKMNYTTYSYKVLKKLSDLGLILNFRTEKNEKEKSCCFAPHLIKKIKFYHRPTTNLNMKNYRNIIKQELENNPYNSLLITTSKGLMTLKEAVKNQAGGYVIAKYTSNTEVFYQ